ncbi:hypothetical protein R5R35_004804 [Gryllus longicercus]|uniref:Phosphoglucomutase-2 n=1 Tax=Gryllus longicercus TaxID=2509291 RepID=A0AAN9VUU6_9ORTH
MAFKELHCNKCKHARKGHPLNEKIQEWLKWDKNEETRGEIQELKDCDDKMELHRLLFSRVRFGTAGIRVKMGPGYSQINDLVIIQTTQGLCKYLELVFPEARRKAGVVIGYDNRHNSKKFAELTATIFVNQSMPVYMFSKVCPAPFISFTIRQLQCVAGVMITASHNPREYNGYKMFWDTGAPARRSDEKKVERVILNNLAPWEKSWDTSVLNGSPLFRDPQQEMETRYCNTIIKPMFPDINKNSNITFTFTPLHGVGYEYMLKAFESAQLKPFVVVEEQRDPDPDFSTVKYPNPEEGEEVLDLAYQTADDCNSTIVLATDPDADKLGVSEKMENGEWKEFTGNEVGTLLGWWMLFRHKQNNPNIPLQDVYMISSAVSSHILKSMAKFEGFNFRDTLIGFKWLANTAIDLVKEGKTVIFAFEESYGYMCGTDIPNKDAITAGIHIAELATYLEKDNMTLRNKLDDIYLQYGHHIYIGSYFICYEPDTMKRIFNKLSSWKGQPDSYPDSILGGKYNITAVRDLKAGYDSSEPDLKPKLPVTSSFMITFTFDNGLVATLRTSGTEPKIKYYVELCSQPEEKNWEQLRSVKREMLDAIITEFLEPNKNGLLSRAK